jgi:hypothetical protein
MKGRDTMPASGISTPRLQRITDMLHTYLDDKMLAGMNALGEFSWDGAFSTYFWIDRHEQLCGVLLTQHQPNAYYPIANQFKALFQAR